MKNELVNWLMSTSLNCGRFEEDQMPKYTLVLFGCDYPECEYSGIISVTIPNLTIKQ